MPVRIDLPPYPRGWFAVAFSDDLADRQVIPLHVFGRELVLFRAVSGRAALLDAYCPHLGAHLGKGGVVDGDALVCPFHRWRWAGDGRCLGMPYGNRVPATARARAWAVREQNGVILSFYDPGGADPDWEVPVFDETNWSAPETMQRDILGHPQEVLENVADIAHLRFIHKSSFNLRAIDLPTAAGPYFEIRFQSDPLTTDPASRIEGRGFCHGPGLAVARITANAESVRAVQRVYVTPIDGDRVRLFGMVNIEQREDLAAGEEVASQLTEAIFREWEGDIRIWEHKIYRPDPALNDEEVAYIPVYRRWFSQFYGDEH